MSLKSINPTTGETISTYSEMAEEAVCRIVSESYEACNRWRRSEFSERSALLFNTAAVLRSEKDDLANLMALEMGKPVQQGRSEIEKCAWVCGYYAENGAGFLESEHISTDASKSYISFRPIGPVLAVMPWNFPFWQVFRFAAPALMAGNSAILKHSSNVTGCSLAIEKIFLKAGFPENIFRSLVISSNRVAGLLENSKIMAVSLTGSTGAGRAVGAKAGSMLKNSVLELGGSDPYVILEDADIEAAVEACATSRLINSGQSCISAKRFIVVDQIYTDFIKLFIERFSKIKMGNPLSEDTNVGPQARVDLRDELHNQVISSVALGAEIITGGKIPEGAGAYYPPTIITGVKKGMPVFDEETFGPVAAVIKASGEKEAIRIANDSVFGLGAAVFTRDRERGERIAVDELEAGACFVNCFVRSDPRLPFGGIKESGYGRELSREGIREFVNIKTVYIK